jgi:hypothetical protein
VLLGDLAGDGLVDGLIERAEDPHLHELGDEAEGFTRWPWRNRDVIGGLRGES